MQRVGTITWLKLSGLFTWALVGLGLVVIPNVTDQPISEAEYLLWLGLQLFFGVAFWLLVDKIDQHQNYLRIVGLLLLASTSALVLSYASQTGLGMILLLLIAGLLPWLLPLTAGIAWLFAQTVAVAFTVGHLASMSTEEALLFSAFYFAYASFTFALSWIARRQAMARNTLRKLNSELRATQALLAESTRLGERVRIARELHDLIGHHLTGLSIHLEVASHLVDGKAREHVDQAQAVAKSLLTDVREVVGTLRHGDAIELNDALRQLAEGVPVPTVHLELPERLEVSDPQRAQVILRCTQEIITNAVRHSGAENLWLRIDSSHEGLDIEARDDGHGVKEVHRGNGLVGMTERLEQLGGKLSVESSWGRGFALRAWLPREVAL